MSDIQRIRRAFADMPSGQLHYRTAGEGPVVLLLHASPGSSRQLEPLIGRLAGSFRVLAPDTPGNGDSTPLPVAEPGISDYTRAILGFLDALDVGQADVYGTHTGACIGSELALLAPDRVRRLVQDGVVIFSAEKRREMIENYARPFEPDLNGTHLIDAFMFCRDQFMFFPWYASDPGHRRDSGLPPAPALHAWVVEVLKAATSYHLAYRAAFAYPADERLPQVTQPVLCIAAEDDPLAAATAGIAGRLPDGQFSRLPRFDDPRFHDSLAATIMAFLR